MTTNNLNNVPEVYLGSQIVIGDLVHTPGGSNDSTPPLPTVNNTPISAALAILSTQGGVQLPSLTTSQINNLVAGSGMLVFNSSTNLLNFSVSGVWYPVDSSIGPITAPQISLGNGSAASPSLTFINDGTTGLFLESAGSLGLSAAGALQAVILGTGNENNSLVLSGGHNANPTIGVVGASANIGINFICDGTGVFSFLSELTHTNPATLSIFNLANNHSVSLKSPSALSSDVTFTLPGSFTAGQFMTVDVSGNLSFSAIALANTHSIYVSKTGNDSTGTGSIANPFLTIQHAQSTISTATKANQWNIIIDPGTYSETNLKIYPNINWVGSSSGSVFISNNVAINLNSTWEGTTPTTADFSASGITVTTAFGFDTTGFTTVGGTFNFTNITTSDTTFKQADSSHQCSVYFNGGCYLASTNLSVLNFESVSAYSAGGNAMGGNPSSAGNLVIMKATNGNSLFISTGDIGPGNWTLITNGAHNINFEAKAGGVIGIGTLDASGGGQINVVLDNTTYQSPNGVTFSGTVSYSNANLTVLIVSGTQQLTPQLEVQCTGGSLSTLTLPTNATVGDWIKIKNVGTGGWTIAQNSGQSITWGSFVTTVGVGGSLSSTAQGDCINIVCTSTSATTWIAESIVGNLSGV